MKNFTRISVLVAASAMAVLTGCATGAQQESTGQYIDDTATTTRVKNAIYKDEMLKSSEISVETFKGRVQLSGVQGVTSVTNDLRLK